jgi:ferrous iron transport protein A
MHEFIPLSALHPGQSARVRQVVGHDSQVRRLEEMGLRTGTQVELVRQGSPCIVRLSDDQGKISQTGSKLCFRDGDMLQVMVSV